MSLLFEEVMEERVVIVDECDQALGCVEKLLAHRTGLLHRAFSVVILNQRGEMLLQRRALSKYHSGGLWSNACCGHPRLGEGTIEAGERRLQEELGISCTLRETGSFVYTANLDGSLVEHEYDHVLLGSTDANPVPDPLEAMAWRWMDVRHLTREMSINPSHFTAWFPMVLAVVRDALTV
ncbi:MAG: isopentenyl-diphosphate Delta-isomerase [Gemmatimonadaceae bacterium]